MYVLYIPNKVAGECISSGYITGLLVLTKLCCREDINCERRSQRFLCFLSSTSGLFMFSEVTVSRHF